ncbi:RidA family protein (plasmid) [Bosea sp. F3-2]|uniref:RidA family protein n=1 Tax=Bosea sp. F3-2 TaxID=2599640 RepID=UPI0011EFF360|nr:RidA family protein [Bosea sp. F3-2]QEL27357.1 RidA family protein [Bosea sp. F3-2]
MEIVHVGSKPRASEYIEFNNVVYVSGLTAPNRDVGIEGQTQQVLDRIDAVLAKAGTHKGKILAVQVFLANIDRDFDAMNTVWDKWTDPDHAPTRATVQAPMARKPILIEMVVQAAK